MKKISWKSLARRSSDPTLAVVLCGIPSSDAPPAFPLVITWKVASTQREKSYNIFLLLSLLSTWGYWFVLASTLVLYVILLSHFVQRQGTCAGLSFLYVNVLGGSLNIFGAGNGTVTMAGCGRLDETSEVQVGNG